MDSSQINGMNASDVKEELDRLYELKVSILRQIARIAWSAGGDKNTKFFNKMVQKRRCRNTIRKLIWQGELITNPS